MRPRCVELARVLKKTGSFYYHCDWHASHYVKVMLDQIFGENNFVNEIIWQRTSAHNDPRQFGRVHDTIFYYHGGKEKGRTWNQQYDPTDERFYASHDFEVDAAGRKFRKRDLTAPGHDTTGADSTSGKAGGLLTAECGATPKKTWRLWRPKGEWFTPIRVCPG